MRNRTGWAVALMGGILLMAISCAGSGSPKPVQIADARAVADGTWEGRAYWFPNDVKVKVRVESGRIISVDILKHFQGQGKPAEAITEKVITAQSLIVDTVSGATHSSITIIRAIENALSGGMK